jgi:hypothetical protein
MPRGKRADEAAILDKIRKVRQSIKNGTPVTAARQAEGLTASTWARWNKKYENLTRPEVASETKQAVPSPRHTSRRRRTSAGSRRSLGNGHGPAAVRPGRAIPDRHLAMHRENQTLRDIVIDQMVEIHQLKRAARK